VERVSAGVVAAIGLYAAVRNRYFAEASVATSRKHFGIHLREGSRAYRFNWIFSSVLAIVIGTLMVFLGGRGPSESTGARSIYRPTNRALTQSNRHERTHRGFLSTGATTVVGPG
jgi:hypothetical protein